LGRRREETQICVLFPSSLSLTQIFAPSTCWGRRRWRGGFAAGSRRRGEAGPRQGATGAARRVRGREPSAQQGPPQGAAGGYRGEAAGTASPMPGPGRSGDSRAMETRNPRPALSSRQGPPGQPTCRGRSPRVQRGDRRRSGRGARKRERARGETERGREREEVESRERGRKEVEGEGATDVPSGGRRLHAHRRLRPREREREDDLFSGGFYPCAIKKITITRKPLKKLSSYERHRFKLLCSPSHSVRFFYLTVSNRQVK